MLPRGHICSLCDKGAVLLPRENPSPVTVVLIEEGVGFGISAAGFPKGAENALVTPFDRILAICYVVAATW